MIKLEGSQAPFGFGNSWKKGGPLEKVTGYDLDHWKAMTWHHCAYIPTSTSTSHQPGGHLKKPGLSVQSGCLKPLFPTNSVLVLNTDTLNNFIRWEQFYYSRWTLEGLGLWWSKCFIQGHKSRDLWYLNVKIDPTELVQESQTKHQLHWVKTGRRQGGEQF